VGKNVAVFVDVANIFYAAKAAGVDIDYVTLLKSAVAGRDFVRAYAYTGLDPENENQRNFHSFLARHGYRVVSKDIRKYGDGKVKANLDIELVVDLMKTARNLDVAIIVSGDGDFAPAIRAVQEMGVRCEVISFRGNTSSDLIDVADLFTDITQIARVEKGSSRSGRRVAGDEADLSMTEVPDKQTEGTGRGRARTGRGRGRAGEAEPVAATARTGRGRGRATPAEAEPTAAAGGSLIVLPGEKLSRVRSEPAPAGFDEEEQVEGTGELEPIGEPPLIAAGEETDADGRRRRRRRGGRGRGRGRGRDEQPEALADAAPASDSEPIDEIEEPIPARRAPRPAAFGSVWDTQMGVPRQPTRSPLPPEEEFDDEPAIPEYLIAERRGMTRGASRGPVGGRGGRARSGYSAAVDRERYGRGGGGGINRYPDVSGRAGNPPRGGRDGGRREERFGRSVDRDDRIERPDRGRGRGQQAGGGAPRPGEQWSEVPPELEALLRAQLAAKGGPGGGPAGPATQARTQGVQSRPGEAGLPAAEQPESRPGAPGRGRGRPKAARESEPAAQAEPAGPAEAAAAAEAAEAPPKRRPGRPRKTADVSAAAAASAVTEPPTRRRTSHTRSAAADAAVDAAADVGADAATRAGQPPADGGAAGAPRRRAARPRTATPASATDAGEATEGTAGTTPRRRTTRKSTVTASES
jgi:uncharacterized LabA/DUF88 family protein